MKKNLKRSVALFLALAVMVAYSFSPQALTAYAVTGSEDDAQAQQTEQQAEPETKAEPEKKAEAEEKAEPEEKAEADEPSESEEEKDSDADAPDDADADSGENEQTDADADTDADAVDPAEETEEETEEAEEEEADKYPAVSFNKTAGGVNVTIKAPEGALPEGATVKVVAVKTSTIKDAVEDLIDDGKVIKAVDITFYDKDGKQIEPKKKVSVSFASDKFSDLNEPAVVHINDEGIAERVPGSNVNTDTNKATFKSDEFSVYAIIETGSEEDASARLKIIFRNGDEDRETIYVKKADTNNQDEFETILYDPGVGEVPEDAVFKGWTTKADYSSEDVDDALDIDGVRADVTERLNGSFTDGTEVVYYAMMFRQFTVSYKDEEGTSLGTHNVTIPVSSSASSAEYTVNMAYTPHDADQDFEGWLVSDGADKIESAIYEGESTDEPYLNGTVLTITGNIVLSVNAPHGHWLIFDENGKGGTYNAPKFYKSGETTAKPRPDSEMVRNGYTFGGWYKDAACTNGNEFTFGGELNTNTTIYAKWNENSTAAYTVIIWKQNVSGEGYDYAEHIPLTGRVNTTVNTVSQQGTGNNAYAVVNGVNKQYTGFHLKSFDQEVTINPEGNAVVNVYYDRTEYTLTFDEVNYTRVNNPSNNDTQLYGYVDGLGYVKLTRRNRDWQFEYNGTWQYYS